MIMSTHYNIVDFMYIHFNYFYVKKLVLKNVFFYLFSRYIIRLKIMCTVTRERQISKAPLKD